MLIDKALIEKQIKAFKKHLIIAGSFIFGLMLFIHFREGNVEFLELNTTAKWFVTSQTNFNFGDDQATLILKQESIRDLGKVFQLEENQIHKIRASFETFLIHNQSWRKELEKTTFEEMDKGADDIEDALLHCRFTDQRTLQKIRDLEIDPNNIYVLPEKFQGILPGNFWSEIKSKAFASAVFEPDAMDFIIHFFDKQKWTLQNDASWERNLRQVVEERTPKKYTHVASGSHIIEPGEKVTPRHIAMLQAMKNALDEGRTIFAPLTLLGSFLMAIILCSLAGIYFAIFHRDIFKSIHKLTLFVSVVLFTLGMAKLIEYLLLYHGNNSIEVVRFPLVIPLSALIISALLGPAVAIFSTLFLLLVLNSSLVFEDSIFLAVNFVSSLVVILLGQTLHKRKEIFSVCAFAWLASIPVIMAFNLAENRFWDFNLFTDIITTLVFMSLTAVLAIVLLPLLESVFHVMTDMSLMEYMDPNSELLRRLSVEAPGTYQHSLVVGNLSEAAARAIGANGVFCRASTLYHDIGKLFNPHYFTENQLGGFNIHQLLTPQESTQVIIAHATEGENLARKHHLPQSFIDIIREHHGTTMVYYFYCKQLEQMGGDRSKVHEKAFRYPGPKPRSKESAIIMIADCVEAASRSLEEITEQHIVELVDKIVAEKISDGQFEECALTFEDLTKAKKAMVKAITVARHGRIKYPEKR